MFQQLIIIGNLGADARVNVINDERQVANFPVAVSIRRGTGENKTEQVLWFSVAAWNNLCKTLAPSLRKGTRVQIVGTLIADENGNPRTFQRDDGSTGVRFEMTAEKITLLSPKPTGDGDSGADAF